MALKHLDYQFKIETKDIGEDGEYFTFEGYASTFGNTDLGDDVVVSGAFSDSLKQRTPKLLYQHDLRFPIGVIEEAREDVKGLFIRAKLPKNNTKAADVGSLIKCGALDSMSIGFSIRDFDVKDQIRYIKRADLYEVSVVTFPMNEQAVIMSSKSLLEAEDAEKIITKREFERCLRESGMFSKQAATILASRFNEQGDPAKDDKSEDEIKSSELLTEIKKLLNKL